MIESCGWPVFFFSAAFRRGLCQFGLSLGFSTFIASIWAVRSLRVGIALFFVLNARPF